MLYSHTEFALCVFVLLETIKILNLNTFPHNHQSTAGNHVSSSAVQSRSCPACACTHTDQHITHPPTNPGPEPKPRNPQVGAVLLLDALRSLFGANCQWETSARTALDKTGCWGEQILLHEGGGDNGGRMCWCAAGGWGGTMDGLVSPLADWFEMAPLSLSPWGVPLSRFWFPLLTNSKQKSISFSRDGGWREAWGVWNINPCFCRGKWLKNLFVRDRWLSNSSSLFMWLYSALCLHPLHLSPLTRGGGDGE